MRKFFTFVAIIAVGLICGCVLVYAQEADGQAPRLRARVNDFAQVLTADQRRSLEEKSRLIEELPDHPQVAVLLPDTMNGATIEQYAGDTARAWKLGQTGKDNGLLIVIAPKERKWRLEVGYGLESVIPDSTAKRILTNDMDPHLKGGKTDFYGALDAAMTTIHQRLEHATAEPPPPSEPWPWELIMAIVGAFTITSTLIGLIVTHLSKQRREEQDRHEEMARIYRDRLMGEQVRTTVPHYDSTSGTRRKTGSFVTGAAVGAAASSPRRTESSSPSSYSSPDPTPSYTPSIDTTPSFSGGGGDFGGGGASSGD